MHGGWIDTPSAVQLMDEIIEHLQSINAGPPAPPISMLENIDTASAWGGFNFKVHSHIHPFLIEALKFGEKVDRYTS